MFCLSKNISIPTSWFGGSVTHCIIISILAYALSSVLNPRVAHTPNKKIYMRLMKGFALVLAVGIIFVLFIPLSKWVLMYTIEPHTLPVSQFKHFSCCIITAVAAVPLLPSFCFDIPCIFLSVGAQLAIIVIGNGIFVPEYGLAAAAWTRLLPA
jgi:hypothetical protein